MRLTPPSERLRRAVGEARRRAHDLGRPLLISVTERVGGADALAAFAAGAQLGAAPLFWEGRARSGERLALAGIGAAHTITAGGDTRFSDVDASWRALLRDALIEALDDHADGPGPLLMGGASFDPRRPRTTDWQGFPDALFILPRYLVAVAEGMGWLTTNALVHPGDDGEAVAAAVLRGRAALLGCMRHRSWDADPHEERGVLSPSRAAERLDDRPSALEWQETVARTAADIHAGRFAKVVLARQARLTLDGPEHAGARAVRALARLRRDYPDSFLFAVAQPGAGTEDGAVFLGASPERLVRLDHGAVEATCLAGSIRRGGTPDEDAALGRALLESEKDRAEHAVVATMLREALGPVCRSLEMPDAPALLRLANVQHLYTPLRGVLRNGHGVLDLVARLHPTPAVGGHPRAEALRAIREREALDRGWYAGPVGWIDRAHGGEFAVAIRSALLRDLPGGPEALLFSGCGIMADSDPATEFQESRLKMRVMLGALG